MQLNPQQIGGRHAHYQGQSISGSSRVHLGDVYNQYSLPLQEPSQKPKPTSIVPFGRDSDYIERRNILDILRTLCSTNSKRVALVGLGGVGKSQIAIEYAHRAREADQDLWVFWIHSATATRFRESLHVIADVLQLPGREDYRRVPWLVKRWLESQMESQWLLIIDNIDDKDVLTSRHTIHQTEPSRADIVDGLAPLTEYIPRTGIGATLFTSRNLIVARSLVEEDHIVSVEAMEIGPASRLAQTKLTLEYDPQDIRSLVTELDCMPLAITQAAAYINHRRPRITIDSYLTRLRKSGDKTTMILEKDLGDLRRDARGSSNSIILTWQISFEQIRREKRVASDLLSMMSMFDRESIPERLLRRPWEESECDATSSDGSSDLELEDDFQTLRSFCLINTIDRYGSDSTLSNTFAMHRLVQLATRHWLKKQNELDLWEAKFTTLLNRLYPVSGKESFARCEKLLPHVASILEHASFENATLTVRSNVLSRAAKFAYETGRYGLCARMSDQAMKIQVDLFGSRHPAALLNLHQLAVAHSQEGKLAQAAEAISRSRNSLAEVLGKQHPQTLACMHDYALILRTRGQYEAAEEETLETFAQRKAVLGHDHPDTLSTLSSLSVIKQRRGKLEEARICCAEALEGQLKVSGDSHVLTFTSMHDMGVILRKQGQFEEAENWSRAALSGRTRIMSTEHPAVLSSMTELAVTLERLGRYNEAEQLTLKALQGRENIFGARHQSTLTSLNNFAALLRQKGDLSRAEEVGERALIGRRESLGVDHADTLTSASNLALILQKQGRFLQAEAVNRQTLERRERVLGTSHPSTLTTMNNLAVNLREQGRLEDARVLLETCVEHRSRHLGRQHVETLTAASNLALVIHLQGKFVEAEALNRSVLGSRETKLGFEHPSTLTSVHCIGMGLQAMGKSVEAKDMFMRALTGRTKVLGETHPATVMTSKELDNLNRTHDTRQARPGVTE